MAPGLSRRGEFREVSVGFGAKMKFWHDFYSIQDGAPVLSFVDPRLQDGLGPLGRTFVFSAMHHLIAVGDFEGARLEILRFPKNRYTGEREVEVFSFDERNVVDETVLNEAIDRTFKIWIEIIAERARGFWSVPIMPHRQQSTKMAHHPLDLR